MTANEKNDLVSRASGPVQEHAYRRGPRIVALETIVPHDFMPGLMALRIHTDAGVCDGEEVIGHGETYYIPTAAASVIHDFFAPRLLGADALAIESHWRFLSQRCAAFGGTGAELRALSAMDLALWDIAGQLARQPVWRLLGGPIRDAVPVYNSCGGPYYGRGSVDRPRGGGWPGHGDPGRPGPLEDNWASLHNPAELAQELVELGYRGIKLWSFDAAFRRCGGDYLPWDEIRQGTAPFQAIRAAVGDKIEVMLDGHGFFSSSAARRIASTMHEFRPLWLEDILRPDSVEAMAAFRADVEVPLAVSEMLVTPEQYRQVLMSHAADYVMIDPTWVGGISATKRLAELAQLFCIPSLMHDCTGPFTLLAGVQVAGAVSGVAFQETVRAHVSTLYPALIDQNVVISAGQIALPERPGLGARWRAELFDREHPGYRFSSHGSSSISLRPRS